MQPSEMGQASEIRRRTDLATALVRKVGALALSRFEAGTEVSYKVDHEMVTPVDAEIEGIIVAAIKDAYPEDDVFGEEGGGAMEAAFTWIIDPIDGTTNFARGIAHWCVSIGLMSDDDLVAGVIFDPCRAELFIGIKGEGASLNGAVIWCERASLTHLAIGLGVTAKAPADTTFAPLSQLVAEGHTVRIQGAGALTVSNIAAGRLDAFYESLIFIWDIAAAAVILREAGGEIRFPFDRRHPDNGFSLLAGTPMAVEYLSDVFFSAGI